MSTLVTRAGKGSPLTHNEVDANFTNLNTDKVEKTAAAITGGTINNTTVGATTPSTGVFTTLTATGQTSLGGVAGSESLRVVTPAATGSFVQVQSESVSFVGLRANGSNPNNGLGFISRGTGAIGFYTNNSTSNLQLNVSPTASAVNYHQLTGSATGSGPIHSVAGSDTNIDLNLTTKGTGVLNLNTGSGTQVRIIDSGGTAVNRIHLQGQGTGFLPVIASRGSDTNLGMSYSTQGTGGHDFYTAGTSFTQQVKIAHTASAVNYVQVTGAATGGVPTVIAQGSDSSVGMGFATKSANYLYFLQSGANPSFRITTGATSNYLDVKGAATGADPVLSAQGSDTNIDLVLSPKGTGALQAQQTDSTATGGNARGANAVDWQTSRSSASQVASGTQSFIGAGTRNTSSNFYTGVVAGYTNTASGFSSFIGSGNQHITSGTYSSITSGFSNVASNTYTSVVNGNSNTAAGYYNFIGNGQLNSGTSGSAVTTQSATMNGTTAVTLSGSNASIKVGQIISGTSINEDTYVAAISGTSLTLSKVASGSSTSTLSFFTPHGVVVGGGNNQAAGSYSFIGGGGDAGTAANRNVASGAWSAVVGGTKNTASGVASFIGGGGTNGTATFANTASGGLSVISGGWNNTASADLSTISGGQSHFATAAFSTVAGGTDNIANGSYSSVLGGAYGTVRSIVGNTIFPACAFPIATSTGVSQAALLVLGVQTTDATATVLRSNTSAAGTTNQVILPNNSAYYFKVEIIANVTGGGNTSGWELKGVIKRGANAASTTIVGSVTSTLIAQDAGASTWAVSATADTTNGGLKITCTGQASTTIRWVAKASTTEVTF